MCVVKGNAAGLAYVNSARVNKDWFLLISGEMPSKPLEYPS